MLHPRGVTLRLLVALLAASALSLLASPGAFAKTYCTSPALAIPDNNLTGVTTDIVVSDHLTITDVNVSIAVTHTWVGDLSFTLNQVGGVGAALIDRPGVPATPTGCALDDIDVILDDEATNGAAEDACESPLGANGPYTPSGLVRTFVGDDIFGTWRLLVWDAAGGDTGTIVQWCLIFQSSLDIDGDGEVDALTDGILMLRHQFTFTGALLVNNAVDLDHCTRCTAEEIKTYLDEMP